MASLPPQAEVREGESPPPENEDLLTKYIEIEEEFCSAGDHMAMLAENACSPNLVWREMVCKWGYDVVDMMGEARSVVYVAMNILDRFCAVVARTEVPMNEKRYECASMTALFLAARVAGTCNLQMSDLIHMSRDSVQLQDLISMGKQMLNVLTWGPRLITPVDFLQAMLPFLPDSVEDARRSSLFESASFLVEIAVCDIYLSRFPASQVAFAAILNAVSSDGMLSHSEVAAFTHQMEQKVSLLQSSIDTRTIRTRLDSVYNRIEDNHEDNSNSLHYISDDEEDEVETPTTSRKRSYPAGNEDHQEENVSLNRDPSPSTTIDQERHTKRARRPSFCQS